ncbi:MAG: hypothetical protein ACI9WC_001009, partial [Arenicella sp.]
TNQLCYWLYHACTEEAGFTQCGLKALQKYLTITDTSLSLSVLNLTDEEAPAAMHFIGYDARTHSPQGRVAKLSMKHTF